MKKNIFYIIIVLTVLLSACSTKRNTSSARALKALNTRYNVYFNGKTSYDEGLKNINQANTDDYAAVINMYAISKHENANAAKSSMDRTIEKCRKAIKLHSIKQKPERDNKKWNDPEYQNWYNQKEFNPALKDAWMLLGQAEFHKADFLGAVGTFTYISRYYSTDKDIIARCQLWIARSYAELGWIYEAEQVMLKLKQDDLLAKHTSLYASVNADLLLKKRQYKEAIPFLELTLRNEKDKTQKQRFTFLLAQLYQKTGNNEGAYKAFSSVSKLNPPYEMDFNARIYKAELSNNIPAVRKDLKKMIANPNNKDYKDQLFYVMGKTYLQEGDTLKAIENFIISADTSTRNGFDKAITLITLGDIYYNKQNYIKAQPCYDEASKIITVENEDYNRVSKRAETLSELVTQAEIVNLQDSLQQLSQLSVDKRKDVVKKIIDKIIADEKAAEEADKKAKNANMPENFDDNFESMPPLGMSPASGEWYFYNPSIIKTGAVDFRKKWGKRKLEDNWRRLNKTASLFAEETGNNGTQQNDAENKLSDTTTITDIKSPEFYLRQIPVTSAQIKKSNEEIATALYNMGFIYKDKVEDLHLALKTFDEFERRFPTDERRVETYYYSYIICNKNGDDNGANIYKSKLTANFPASKYVEVVSQPDYFERLNKMYQEQDSIYYATYKAYNANDFKTVKANTEYVQKTYPLSELLPKFIFLEALSVGKTEKSNEFEKLLTTLIEKYPSSDVSSMAKDILALIKQGNEAKTGTSHGSLLTRRDEAVKQEVENTEERKFSADKTGKHRLLLIFNPNIEIQNKLLYNIAAFNFTRFMVKDFELITSKLDSTNNVLSITNFESFDEVEWYLNTIATDENLSQLIQNNVLQRIVISEQNYGLMFSYLGLDAYKKFVASGFNNVKANDTKNDVKLASSDNKKPKNETKNTEKPVQPATKTIANETIKKETAVQTEIKTQATNTATKTKPEVNTVEKTEPAKPLAQQTEKPALPKQEPVLDNVPLFKNLFAYRANETHYVAISVLNGNFDFDKLKATFDSFNAKNYSMLNLKLQKETFGKQQVVIIGSFVDANQAKSYLFRIIKEENLYEQVKNTDYRNLLGSQRNLNVMMQQNAMETYFEFMQEYYLK